MDPTILSNHGREDQGEIEDDKRGASAQRPPENKSGTESDKDSLFSADSLFGDSPTEDTMA